ncbi:nucleotidyltransferase domain-containing protein [Oceanirhabdus sp. W0125-5]|uniref:nucleotidyltransferase domain-containing protein n=1 Tax=Oceanirhabdus sp. W0125-5 TaxID=2999116 RepID=UPI0022F30D03|nr:hypothetical protein [Oceanirhabdus sp. W0125-5]WBW97038.1 hypothetical protein OW730_25605 [Oceanirhabdus sp. W0125-5]
MNCFCYERDNKFVLCVEDIQVEYENILKEAFFQKSGNRFIKEYPNSVEDKKLVSSNFQRLGEEMFTGKNSDWKAALDMFARECNKKHIEWYLIGSAADAARGVQLNPHDIDIMVNTKDFYRVRDLFKEYIVEPFVDNEGTWVVRYFGRLCICGMQVDIAADHTRDANNYDYEKEKWNDYVLYMEPFESRYQTEIMREREERISLLDEFRKKQGNRKI